ncbi:MAG: NPCBM/NEW2 domain-containing protein [Phycisphaerae bacterium]|nr:NPCBM/NEW2 domain-containing protein [Phycisphaerae bacterium]
MSSVLLLTLMFNLLGPAQLNDSADVSSRGVVNPPAVIVTTLDGREFDGSLVSWSAKGELEIRIADHSRVILRADELDLVQMAGAERRSSAAAWEVRLVDGSRFGAMIEGADDEHILFQIDGVGGIRQPIDAIRSVMRAGTNPVPTAAEELKLGADSAIDRVRLQNGDNAYGILTAVDAEGVTFIGDDGESEERFEWDVVMALNCGSDRSGIERNERGGWLVRMDQGAELACESIDLDGKSFRLKLRGGVEVLVEVNRMLAIESARLDRVWLSQVNPVSYESIPFFNTSWPLGIDQNAIGGTLQLSGREYARGLGLHSACRATWRVPVGCRRLTGWVGIDDSAGPKANADFVVRAGQRVIVKESGLLYGERPRRIDVELGDDVEISIDVGFGRFGDVHDRVNFVNSCLRP